MNSWYKVVVFWAIVAALLFLAFSLVKPDTRKALTLTEFLWNLNDGRLRSADIYETKITGKVSAKASGLDQDMRTEDRIYEVSVLPNQVAQLSERLFAYNEAQMAAGEEGLGTVTIQSHPQHMWILSALTTIVPFLILIVILIFIVKQMQMGGTKAMSFGKSRARLSTGQNKVTFDDVAGANEAKEDLEEIIDFLKDPQKYQKLGGKIPKGVLLCGPPGTGKTLLARAVAGEANVPFFSISGSDFVEMFVGVGASRVRDLFDQGKKNAPCIIFIDEIDAVGRQRFAGIGGGHDEREQTLNQLLVEMDGFNANEGVILIAATNREDTLDQALMRPGRFDRRIVVDIPDMIDRHEILKVHTRDVKLGPNVDLEIMGKRTPGFSGADLANLVNEAALLAARRNKDRVEMSDFEEAVDKVIAGAERKSRVLNEKEKRVVAYHETGHALMAVFVEETDPLHKVSILPRGRFALGYTLNLPSEEKFLRTKEEILGNMVMLLAGRAAEELTFDQITTGAQNDIERATQMARAMVCNFGMTDRLGLVSLNRGDNNVFLGRDIGHNREYSENIASEIDKEVRSLMDQCYNRAKDILTEHKHDLEKVAQTLLEREVLDANEVLVLLGLKEPEPEKGETPPPSTKDPRLSEQKQSDEDEDYGAAPGLPQHQPT